MQSITKFPIKQTVSWLSLEMPMVAWLVVLSIGLALSEGMSVSLLIPALDATATTTVFGNVPGLRSLAAWLSQFPDAERLKIVASLLAAGVLVRGLMQFGSQYLAALIPLRLQATITMRSYHALLSADADYMSARNYGELYTLIHDHPLRAAAVLNGVLTFIVSGALIVTFGVLMVLISWQMTLASLAFLALAQLIMRALSKPWFAWAGERLSKVMADVSLGVTETITGRTLIKMRLAEPLMERKFNQTINNLVEVERRRFFFSELQSPVLITMSGLFICCLLALALALYGVNDKSWTGLFILFIICLYRLVGPASRLTTALAVISSNQDAFTATEEFVAAANCTRLPNGTRKFESLHNSIDLEGVGLRYAGASSFALEDVNIKVKRGEVVALVGGSGAGKTSAISLLMRMRDPSPGVVAVDGFDLKEYDLGSWRRRIAVVSQDIVLFNDSVRANICFGLDNVPEENVWAALREASAEDFVRALPGALDAPLGDAGQKLSGGQRQRLALARALLIEPEVLILDEATSNLDSITEASIQQAIEGYRGRRTVIIVAHRLSTVRNADRIYVMEHGRVVQVGTHAELYAVAGYYRCLFESQQTTAPGRAA